MRMCVSQDAASAHSQAEAPGSDLVHASRKPVDAGNGSPAQQPEEPSSSEEEEDWQEHMGEADVLRDHPDGNAWAVMWVAGQDALDMEAASDAEVAQGISQVSHSPAASDLHKRSNTELLVHQGMSPVGSELLGCSFCYVNDAS